MKNTDLETNKHDLKPTNFEVIEEKIESYVEQKSFWTSNRILFLSNIAVFFICAVGLMWTERNNNLEFKTFWDYLFNSVSVGTLTGLFRGDAGNYTVWGQFLLMLNMAFSAVIVSITGILLNLLVRFGFGKKESLYNELKNMGVDSASIIYFIIIDLVLVWLVGFVLFKLSGLMGWWESVFNSISHLANDGITAKPLGMIPFANNPVVLLSGAFLITIGGLGISIRSVFYDWVLKLVGLKKIASLIPKSVIAPTNFVVVMVSITMLLQVIGMLGIYLFEYQNPNTLGASTMLFPDLNAYYMSVSSRTAGFSTLPDLNLLNDKSQFLLMFLMTIGASSGSFAGGIFKLTAFVYMLVYIFSIIRGDARSRIRGGYIHFSGKTATEANFRVIGFSTITLLVVALTFLIEPAISGKWLLFEGISAVSNTGLTLGATNLLSYPTMGLIMFLMVVGKLGFVSAIASFSTKIEDVLGQKDTEHDVFSVD